MKLEQQVCTLEQAKRLKELGVKQDSIFYWIETYINRTRKFKVLPKYNEDGFDLVENESLQGIISGTSKNECYSAFTVAELGEMLPRDYDEVGKYYTIADIGYGLDVAEESEIIGFSIVEAYRDTSIDYPYFHPTKGVYTTEAAARAAMLIYLLENKLITA